MSENRVDRIAFRFTRRELEALLRLMDLPALTDVAVRPADPAEDTVQSLVESGVVMACGERTFVDGTISLVLKNAAWSLGRLTAEGPAGAAALYRGERMYVLAEVRGDLVSLEPLQDLRAAREPLLTAAAGLGEAIRVRLAGADGPADEGEGPEALRAFLDRIEAL